MIIFDWLKDTFSTKMKGKVGGYSNTRLEICFKEFAIQSCISLIANAITLSEFQTIEKGKEVKKDNYYMLNVEPNRNQNATEFWHEVITKLVYNNECLVIQNDNKEWFVAETFTQKEYLNYEDTYTGVRARGFDFKKTFYENEVLYFKLNDSSIKSIMDGLYIEYGKLISAGISSYNKANGTKGVVTLDTLFSQQDDAQEQLDDLFENKFKKYFENPNSVLLLDEGVTYDEKDNKSPTKNSRDIKALIDDIIDFVAMGFHMPVGLVKGDLGGVKEVTDNALIFGINPIAKLICGEINRKMYGKELYLQRTYVKVDTQRIKDVDIKTLSSAGDLLFRIGVNSIDDNLKMLGREALNETWSQEHYVTKNYQSVLNENLRGGESNGNGAKNSKLGNKE